MQSTSSVLTTPSFWHPQSWQDFVALQQPVYENALLLKENLQYLSEAPALVSEEEILLNAFYISEAVQGKIFILQAGDCAETFLDCVPENISLRANHLKSMADKLSALIKKPVVIIGRIAGQYAKPRSDLFETIDNLTMSCYRGDLINGFHFAAQQRRHDPRRLLTAYQCAAATAQQIRSQHGNTLFYSHEALVLDYESAMTRLSKNSAFWYNFGAHFLWMGERTTGNMCAHVEYLRGIENPIGIKIGPNINASELISLLHILNPAKKEGRITLITRMGIKHVQKILPTLIQKVRNAGCPVMWSCDPMHGNTLKIGKIKTRYFSSVWQEFKETFEIHKELDTCLAGVHLEVTPLAVTECIGGAHKLTAEDLQENYLSYCDPRLNAEQSLEMIGQMGTLIGGQ